MSNLLGLLFPHLPATCPVHSRTLTQFHKQLINCLNDVGLELGIRKTEILVQASECQEFVQGLLLIALVAASMQSTEATRPKGEGGEEVWSFKPQELLSSNKGPKKGQGPVQKASLGPTQGPGRGPDLPYSSRTIRSTLRTMLPTVVSEGCAAVILRPSLRISSISSPAVQRERVSGASARWGLGDFPLGYQEQVVGWKAKKSGLPHLRCSSGGPWWSGVAAPGSPEPCLPSCAARRPALAPPRNSRCSRPTPHPLPPLLASLQEPPGRRNPHLRELGVYTSGASEIGFRSEKKNLPFRRRQATPLADSPPYFFCLSQSETWSSSGSVTARSVRFRGGRTGSDFWAPRKLGGGDPWGLKRVASAVSVETLSLSPSPRSDPTG